MEKLNCKSLMIGDWVAVNNTPLQIAALGTAKAGFIDAKGEMFYQYYENIEPIPLTIEILEKIGFQQRCEYYHITIEDKDTRYCMEYDILSGKLTINNTWFIMNEVSYVHKLQHALKLCRIEKQINL